MGFVAFSPLANGFLSDAFKKGETFAEGDFRSFMPQYKEENYDANRELLEFVRKLAEGKNATPAQISLRGLRCFSIGSLETSTPRLSRGK